MWSAPGTVSWPEKNATRAGSAIQASTSNIWDWESSTGGTMYVYKKILLISNNILTYQNLYLVIYFLIILLDDAINQIWHCCVVFNFVCAYSSFILLEWKIKH